MPKGKLLLRGGKKQKLGLKDREEAGLVFELKIHSPECGSASLRGRPSPPRWEQKAEHSIPAPARSPRCLPGPFLKMGGEHPSAGPRPAEPRVTPHSPASLVGPQHTPTLLPKASPLFIHQPRLERGAFPFLKCLYFWFLKLCIPYPQDNKAKMLKTISCN